MRYMTCLVLLSLSFPLGAMADCAADLPQHLDWCSRDHGFNEGATCGAQALAGTNVGLPAIAAQPILGNAWDRTNMMGAAEAAYKAGYKEQAVDAAVCCQIHNGAAHACLAGNRDLVKVWLDAH
jgi:hypothetical protein